MNIYLDAGHHVRFGTFQLRGDDLTSAMRLASDIGYRSFDTAQMYQNEREVGDCLRTLGLPRDELLITTKVSPRNLLWQIFCHQWNSPYAICRPTALICCCFTGRISMVTMARHWTSYKRHMILALPRISAFPIIPSA